MEHSFYPREIRNGIKAVLMRIPVVDDHGKAVLLSKAKLKDEYLLLFLRPALIPVIVKPYLAYADSVPEAAGGFTGGEAPPMLPVSCSEEERGKLPPETWAALESALRCDPRPHYHHDPERVYGFSFAGREVRFRVTAEGVEVVNISEPKKGEEI